MVGQTKCFNVARVLIKYILARRRPNGDGHGATLHMGMIQMIKDGYAKVLMNITKVFTHQISVRVKQAGSVFTLLLLASCAKLMCDQREMERHASQHGEAEFVISVKNCGATTSNAYSVHIVRAGEKIKDEDEVFRADKVDDLHVTWEADDLIVIEYKKSRIFKFTNFWQEVQNDGGARQVNIIERSQ